jgi:hypothetical protein
VKLSYSVCDLVFSVSLAVTAKSAMSCVAKTLLSVGIQELMSNKANRFTRGQDQQESHQEGLGGPLPTSIEVSP